MRWLPQIQPLHYAALGSDGAPDHRETAANLARWLCVPVGPGYTFEEIKHGVLGIVKSAEYLGVRWRVNPAYAAEYAALMDRTYGTGHDAYRPLFALDETHRSGRLAMPLIAITEMLHQQTALTRALMKALTITIES